VDFVDFVDDDVVRSNIEVGKSGCFTQIDPRQTMRLRPQWNGRQSRRTQPKARVLAVCLYLQRLDTIGTLPGASCANSVFRRGHTGPPSGPLLEPAGSSYVYSSDVSVCGTVVRITRRDLSASRRCSGCHRFCRVHFLKFLLPDCNTL